MSRKNQSLRLKKNPKTKKNPEKSSQERVEFHKGEVRQLKKINDSLRNKIHELECKLTRAINGEEVDISDFIKNITGKIPGTQQSIREAYQFCA